MNENRVQVIERLKQANNLLITVNSNPTVDQLAACLGITILMNKIGKHATAVFSGKIPSTIEFLKPENTLEKNTDSLRDFIISLDKSKADKLRYKVEDTLVKIFITPYRTSVSEKDLEFSQGDFNVDVVLALGIHDRDQIDQAIMSHGRILHDAIVMSVNNESGESVGTINWVEEKASSLSEMITSIVEDIQPQSLDEQIATALLTGIVAETERFRNEKTTSITMGMSSKLMAAGANQQLIATELETKPDVEPEQPPEVELPEPQNEEDNQPQEEIENTTEVEQSTNSVEDGEIKISHLENLNVKEEQELPEIDPNEIHISDQGELRRAAELAEEQAKQAKADKEKAQQEENDKSKKDSRLIIQPPTLGGTLTANSRPEQLEPTTDPLSTNEQNQQPLLERNEYIDDQTLDKIEQAVQDDNNEISNPADTQEPIAVDSKPFPTSYFNNDSSNTEQSINSAGDMSADSARNAVDNAINSAAAEGTSPPEANASTGSSPLDINLGHQQENNQTVNANPPSVTSVPPTYPTNLVTPTSNLPAENTASDVVSPESPPTVPPPMMPPLGPLNS